VFCQGLTLGDVAHRQGGWVLAEFPFTQPFWVTSSVTEVAECEQGALPTLLLHKGF